MMEELKQCTKCIISGTRKNVIIPSTNIPKRLGIFITDTPTKREDMVGKYIDPYWKILAGILKEYNRDLSDYYITSSIKCCPEENRYAHPEEIQNCSSFLIKEILNINPTAIMFFSDSCAKQFISGQENLVNKIFKTRFCPNTFVSTNPKALRKGTDRYIEFKALVRRFVAAT